LPAFKTESRSSRASYVSSYQPVGNTKLLQVENLIARQEGTRTLMISILAALFASASLVAVGSCSDDQFKTFLRVKEKLTKSTPEHLQLRHFSCSKEGLGNLCCFDRITYVCYRCNRHLLLPISYHVVDHERDPEGRQGKREKSGLSDVYYMSRTMLSTECPVSVVLCRTPRTRSICLTSGRPSY
jgi:hypothetical protein